MKLISSFSSLSAGAVQRAAQTQTGSVHDVRVDLGRGNIGVTEQILHAADIGPSFEQVSGKAVPECVRGTRLWSDARRAASRIASWKASSST